MRVPLTDMAKVIRSKNAGPFELTLDIIFRDQDSFEKVITAKVITKELVASVYQIPVEQVVSLIEFPPAKAIKATIVRAIPSGGLGDSDVYGAQQHAPLMDIQLELKA